MRSLVIAALILGASCEKRSAAPVQRWTCAMHPQYVADKPGDCPICGMKLTLVGGAVRSGLGAAPVAGGVEIDPEKRRLIGLKTVSVKRGDLSAELRTTGRVAFDETRVHKVTARFEGYVEKLHADFTGKRVRKGDPLLSIYSPELVATQHEYLLALKASGALKQSGLPDVADSARGRLGLFGIGDAEIAALERDGKPLHALMLRAPIEGFVLKKTAVAGARVGTDDALFEIVDLSRVWVLADVYEQELPRLELGQKAALTFEYWPGRVWRGKVGYVFPTVDEKTRTVKVRVEVDNPKHELKPEMFGDVLIEGKPRAVLHVPDDAVIDTGTRRLVFVVLGEGRLQPREIETGVHAHGVYEVRKGLSEGEEVAAGASFLLDAESQLRAAVSRMAPARADGGAR